ncbi:MAG TPA: SRPBCC domain-containing protein [Conexibacter sp.]|jgi:carbon monoxide dehydrogenase subunit G
MTTVQGSYRASAPSAALWTALSDPERLAAALPDVGVVDVQDADRFRARVRPSTGLGITPLLLDVRITERDEPTRVRISGDGAAGEHRVAFDVELTLRDDRDGPVASGCEVAWRAEVSAFGVLGSLTQRVLPMLLRDQVALVLAAADGLAAVPAPS